MLLERLRRAPSSSLFPWHLRLRLALPDGTRVPYYTPGWGNRLSTGVKDLSVAWWAALGTEDDGEPWLVRCANFRCLGAEPARILWEEVRHLRAGEVAVIEGEHTEALAGFSASAHPPGISSPVGSAPMARSTAAATLGLRWADGGLVLAGSDRKEVHRTPGGQSSGWSGGDRVIPVGMVLTLDSLGHYGRSGSRSVRNDFQLAIAMPPGSDDRPWTLDDWRSKVAENLAFFADRFEEENSNLGPLDHGWGPFANQYQQVRWNHVRIVGKLGIDPAGVADLQRVYGPEMDHFLRMPSAIAMARLMAGDASILDEPGMSEWLPGIAGALSDDMGPHQWWGRLLLSTADPRIRGLAADVLSSAILELPIAARLERAIDEGEVEASDALAKKVSGARQRLFLAEAAEAGVWLVIAAIAWLFALVSLLRLGWPGRPPSRRLRPAALLVFGGALMLSFDVQRGAIPLLPDEIGILFCLIGVAVLQRTAACRAGKAAVVALAVALVSTGLARVGGGDIFRILAGAGIALAVVTLPWLARALDDGGRPGRRFLLFKLFYAFPVLLMWSFVPVAAVLGTEFEVRLDGGLALLFLLAISAAVLWALSVLVTQAGARAHRLALDEG